VKYLEYQYEDLSFLYNKVSKENLWLREEVDRLRGEKITFHNKINQLTHLEDDSPEFVITDYSKRSHIHSFVEPTRNKGKGDFMKLTQSEANPAKFDYDQEEIPRNEPKQFNRIVENNMISETSGPLDNAYLSKDCFKKGHSTSRSRSKRLHDRSASKNYTSRTRGGSNPRSEDINNIEKVVLETHNNELAKLYQSVNNGIEEINTSINFAMGGVRVIKTEPDMLTEKTFELGNPSNYSPRAKASPRLNAIQQSVPALTINYSGKSPRKDYSPPPIQRNPYSTNDLYPTRLQEKTLNNSQNHLHTGFSCQNSHSFNHGIDPNHSFNHGTDLNELRGHLSFQKDIIQHTLRSNSSSPDNKEVNSKIRKEFNSNTHHSNHHLQSQPHHTHEKNNSRVPKDSKSGFKLIQDSMKVRADKFVINENKLIQDKLKKELESFRSKELEKNKDVSSSNDYDSLSKPEKYSACSYSEETNNFNTLK